MNVLNRRFAGEVRVGDDWFRSASWTDDAAEEFERRLARARKSSRPQYLRIQAVTLLDGSESDRGAAIGLLERLLRDYPDSLEVAFAHELLARAHRRAGRLREAAAHLRDCVELAPANYSMTSGVPELSLAEVLVEQGGSENIEEAVAILSDEDLQNRMRWQDDWFRWYALAAELAPEEADRRKWAHEALELLDAPPQLTHKPEVGRPRPDEAAVNRLRRLVRG